MRRQVTINQLRQVVARRRSKGSAFSLNPNEYHVSLQLIHDELGAMTRQEIFENYPFLTYDLR